MSSKWCFPTEVLYVCAPCPILCILRDLITTLSECRSAVAAGSGRIFTPCIICRSGQPVAISSCAHVLFCSRCKHMLPVNSGLTPFGYTCWGQLVRFQVLTATTTWDRCFSRCVVCCLMTGRNQLWNVDEDNVADYTEQHSRRQPSSWSQWLLCFQLYDVDSKNSRLHEFNAFTWSRLLLEKLVVVQLVKTFSRLLCNQNVHKNPPLDCILSQVNPISTITPCFWYMGR